VRLASSIALVGLFVGVTPAAAQDVATITFAGGAVADWTTTHENMKYFREANPLLRWLDHKPKAMIALGAGLDVAAVYGWNRVMKRHPKWRQFGLYTAAAVRVGIAARNIRVRRTHGPR
jgi:hypothetical protein